MANIRMSVAQGVSDLYQLPLPDGDNWASQMVVDSPTTTSQTLWAAMNAASTPVAVCMKTSQVIGASSSGYSLTRGFNGASSAAADDSGGSISLKFANVGYSVGSGYTLSLGFGTAWAPVQDQIEFEGSGTASSVGGNLPPFLMSIVLEIGVYNDNMQVLNTSAGSRVAGVYA